MPKKFLLLIVGLFVLVTILVYQPESNKHFNEQSGQNVNPTPILPSMAVEFLKEKDYPGSDILIEESLTPESNYDRYIASYQSEGNKIYGLLAVPNTNKPENGYPIIVFLHGYIPPDEYQTTERYTAYQDELAKSGFITYKIDLRGHGNSEGEPVSAHFSEAYLVDTLNAISSLKKYSDADSDNIGIWGHSNGGEIGLRSMVVSEEIDVGVFWAGVVGSFEDMLETYNEDIAFLNLETRSAPELVENQGLPSENPDFWRQIDPYFYLSDISGPVQLHHGTADESVPVELSISLKESLESANKEVELYQYSGGDHNLSSPHFSLAMERTIDFFKRNLFTN